jgi:DNA mismatch endonuclease (patch repair protein)
MVDTLNPERRSRLMSKVKGKNTQMEIKLRSLLHQRGFRFKKNVLTLPGSPDIVLPKYKVIVFIHGCFWHGHKDCNKSRLPSTRVSFWENKRKANLERDARKLAELGDSGWRIAIIWGCSLANVPSITNTIDELTTWILSQEKYLEIP